MATTQLVHGHRTRILVLNPNSSQAMTDGMRTVIDSVGLAASTEVYTYTAPASSPASINDGDDIKASTEAVLSEVKRNEYDGTIVACFSVNPLVHEIQKLPGTGGAVTGIFEASVLTALSLLEEGQKWGIVTTGSFWEKHLSNGVMSFIGSSTEAAAKNDKFAGVESTGLNAGDFHHGVAPEVIRAKLVEATKRLLSRGDVCVIVMGCAGMAGLEEIIREAVCEEKGEEFAYEQLHVVDGVRAALMLMDTTVKHQKLRRTRKADA
jgi:Asp/Glu/hydantoin racemase